MSCDSESFVHNGLVVADDVDPGHLRERLDCGTESGSFWVSIFQQRSVRGHTEAASSTGEPGT